MSETDYKQVAARLGVRHLVGRWGVSLRDEVPSGKGRWRFRLVPLNGWVFDPHEMKQALVDDGWSINAKRPKGKR